jgi:hypothetical protein
MDLERTDNQPGDTLKAEHIFAGHELYVLRGSIVLCMQYVRELNQVYRYGIMLKWKPAPAMHKHKQTLSINGSHWPNLFNPGFGITGKTKLLPEEIALNRFFLV